MSGFCGAGDPFNVEESEPEPEAPPRKEPSLPPLSFSAVPAEVDTAAVQKAMAGYCRCAFLVAAMLLGGGTAAAAATAAVTASSSLISALFIIRIMLPKDNWPSWAKELDDDALTNMVEAAMNRSTG